MPRTPPENSSSSFAMVEGRPSTLAMPSPVSTTRPTSSRATWGANDSTCLRSAVVISSGRIVSSATSALPSGRQPASRRSRAVSSCRLTVPSYSSSPTRTASEPTTVGSRTTCSSTGRPTACCSAAARRCRRPSSSSTAERNLGDDAAATRGCHRSHSRERAIEVVRPPARDQLAHEQQRLVRRPAGEQVRDHCLLRLERQDRVGERLAELSGLRVDAREAEDLVLDTLEVAGAIGGREHRFGSQRVQVLGQLALAETGTHHVLGHRQRDLGDAAPHEVPEQRALRIGGDGGVRQGLRAAAARGRQGWPARRAPRRLGAIRRDPRRRRRARRSLGMDRPMLIGSIRSLRRVPARRCTGPPATAAGHGRACRR